MPLLTCYDQNPGSPRTYTPLTLTLCLAAIPPSVGVHKSTIPGAVWPQRSTTESKITYALFPVYYKQRLRYGLNRWSLFSLYF